MTQAEIRAHFDEILEKELQLHLQKLGKGKGAVRLIGEFVESAYKQNPQTGEHLRAGLDFMMPEIIKTEDLASQENQPIPSVEDILAALEFGSHYRQCRDLIFCSFRSPEAITWEYEQNRISIIVNDHSYFRQLVCETQAFLMNSLATFEEDAAKNNQELIHDTKYWDIKDPKTEKLFDQLEEEAEEKIRHYFDYLPRDSSADLGGYAYSDFLKVFKAILIAALYERLWNGTHETGSVVDYPAENLAEMCSNITQVDQETCSQILKDLSTASRGSFNYIESTDQYLLFPFSFCLIDHIAELLKQYAKRDEKGFSGTCADPIGTALVEKVAGHFSTYPNFQVTTEVNLQKFDKSLPDIDILAISYEPNFGFQIFICEVKNNLPATWAKEHLKHTDKKGAILKAISQIGKLETFIQSEQGVQLLHSIIKDLFKHLNFKKLFANGFMGAINFLIVTPQNIGVLMPAGDQVILNEDFLRHLIQKSDGDSIYLKHHFKHINQILDDSYQVGSTNFKIDDTVISYQQANLKHLVTFQDHQYISSGTLDKLEKDGLDAGYSYINTLGEKENPDQDSTVTT